MPTANKREMDPHTQIILDRYADRQNIGIHHISPDVLVARYLGKVMVQEELAGKTILEIGAGCSQYAALFLESGCKKYYANDLIPERLARVRVSDPRFVELPGDFRAIDVPEPVDITFANLVMMFVMPLLDEFIAKIAQSLNRGGVFLSMDSNYLCPLSIYRRFADRKNNPARLFNPFRYAEAFRHEGFEVERLVPFTPPLPWTTGNWVLGTTFWLRARKI
jgi:SAM-dependent methyltransferase